VCVRARVCVCVCVCVKCYKYIYYKLNLLYKIYDAIITDVYEFQECPEGVVINYDNNLNHSDVR